MSKGKNHNSFLFLTTLGVYLGLVLAGGAAPQVFAHSATTRNFEVSEEIEVKDDLDDKPSDRSQPIEEIVSLLHKLGAWVDEEKFTWDSKFDFRVENLSFERNGNPSYSGTGCLECPERGLFEGAALRIARGLLDERLRVSAGDQFSGAPEALDIRFQSDGSGVQFYIAIEASDADRATELHSALSDYLRRTSTRSKSKGARIVAEKTSSEVNDVKVILVTHLPRASIDSLLATNAK